MTDAEVEHGTTKKQKLQPWHNSSYQCAGDNIKHSYNNLRQLYFRRKKDMTKKDYMKIFSKYGHVAAVELNSSDGYVLFTTKQAALKAFEDLKQDFEVQFPLEYREKQSPFKILRGGQIDKQQSTSSRSSSCDSLANHQRAAPDRRNHERNRQCTGQAVRRVEDPEDPLSNFFPCELTFDGVIFRSVQHAYEWKKAMFHKNEKLAEEIKLTQKAAYCQQIGKALGYLREWNEKKVEFMKELLLLKWEQVPAFRHELEECRGREIVHPIQSSYWGTKMTRSGQPGKNIFGQLLEDVLKIKDSSGQASTDCEGKEKRSDGCVDDKHLDAKSPSSDTCNEHDSPSSKIHSSKTHQSTAPDRAKDIDKRQLSCEGKKADVLHISNTANVVGPGNNDTKVINTLLDRDGGKDVQTKCYEENGFRNQSNCDGTHQSAAHAISTGQEKQLIDERKQADVPLSENHAEDSAAQDNANDPPQMKGLFSGSYPFRMKSIGRGYIDQFNQYAENNQTILAPVVAVGGCDKQQGFTGGRGAQVSHQSAAPDMVKYLDAVETKQDSSSQRDDNKNDAIQNDDMTTGMNSHKAAPEKKENLNSSSVGPIKSIGRGFMRYQLPAGGLNQSGFHLGQHARVTSGDSVYGTHQSAVPVVFSSSGLPQGTGHLDIRKNYKSADTEEDNKDCDQAAEDADDTSKQIFRKDTQNKNKLIIGSTKDLSKVVDTKAPSGGRSSCRTSSNASHQTAAPDVSKKDNTKHSREQLEVRSNYKKVDNGPSLEDTDVKNGGQTGQVCEIHDRFVSANASGHPGQRYTRDETNSSSPDYKKAHQRAAPYSQRGQDKHDDRNQSFKNHQDYQDYGELDLYELCITNFPYNTTVKDLLKPFRLFGANGVKIINNEPGKGTLAFAQFRDYEAAVEAFTTLDMTDFNGRRLKVSFSWRTVCPEDIVFEKTKHLQIRVNVDGLDK